MLSSLAPTTTPNLPKVALLHHLGHDHHVGAHLRAAVLSDLDEGVTAFSPHVSTLELSGFFGGSAQCASYRGKESSIEKEHRNMVKSVRNR